LPSNNNKPLDPAGAAVIAVASATPDKAGVFSKIHFVWREIRLLQRREKDRLRHEIAQVPGLMALLMKPRNGLKWSSTERRELREQLRRFSRLSLYLATAALPGTTLTLPLLAWWLDRRRRRRAPATSAQSPSQRP
jgi:hypothetical protein